MRIYIFIALLSCFSGNLLAQEDTTGTLKARVNWLTWDQAMTAMTFQPKKLMVFVDAEWKPESLKMDSLVFGDSAVQAYLESDYYAVRLNAKSQDTIQYKQRVLIPEYFDDFGETYHQLAMNLTSFKGVFPSCVIFDESMKRLRLLSGYINAGVIERQLAFYADNGHLMSNPVEFGQGIRARCVNPNHPHYRLLLQEQQKAERNKVKEE